MGEGIDEATTQARLWLVEASRIGLTIGLDLLGVAAPTSM
jgi:arginyl-tRNA synthetase